MKKYCYLLLIVPFFAQAQVGVNTATPQAQLDIRPSSQATPSNTDGLLIPKVDAFPVTNPTAAQQSMLVYLTTTSGANPPGFYFWNNPTTTWLPIKGTDGGTLDQAYDFGGAGAGRTITADAGAVLINGNDGLVSTGTLNSGALAPTGAGTKMFWNPRKAAFRAGRVMATQWDDASIGIFSTALGLNTTASGSTSFAFGHATTASDVYSTAFGSGTTASAGSATAFGFSSTASGTNATAFGVSTTASGGSSTTFGSQTTASGLSSTAFGANSTASGLQSTAFGLNATASNDRATAFGNGTMASGANATAFGYANAATSFAETTIGIGATTYTPTALGPYEFGAANATDRLFVIGNAIDANNNDLVDTAERSDALIVLKNGLTRLPSTTNAMITAADGKAVVTKEYLGANSAGTLDNSYDFGGPGAGRNITADTGAVLISGNDGLQVTGTFGSGAALDLAGAGTRMFFNPRKSAFRVGRITGTQWDDASIGNYSAAFGFDTTASGNVSVAFGGFNVASGGASAAFGIGTVASGDYSASFGRQTTASSFAETIFGIGATTYTPSVNGATQFRTANATDRLFTIGNAIDANNNGNVDAAERSDAIIVLKNGLTRLPSTTNAMITAADGKAVVTKEYLAANTSGTLDQAYDFGGAGLGRTITADTGTVLINGTDGLLSTGILGSGVVTPSGAGVKMYWNPRKAAFRAGGVVLSHWDDAFVGRYSVVFGNNGTASGEAAAAFGNEGYAVEDYSSVFGDTNNASGIAAVAFGKNNTAASYAETAIGIGATTYTPSANGAIQFRTAHVTDRLFVIGNAIDANNNGSVDAAERSDAMIVLKNGLTRLPSATNAMITAADGKAVVTKEYFTANTSGTLDQAYDFGGAGAGRLITADAGAVRVTGTDGFQVTGTYGSGAAIDITGPSAQMFFNPRKAAFRAGYTTGTYWNDVNVGDFSTASGLNAEASAMYAVSMGNGNIASGNSSVAMGSGCQASGNTATAFGSVTVASGAMATAFGVNNTASGSFTTALGQNNLASGVNALVTGRFNTAYSFGESVFGIGATNYTASATGATNFQAGNSTDRLFVVGNAIDANANGNVETAERSNALTILKNGRMALGNITPGGQFELSLDQGRKPGTTLWTVTSDERLKTVNGDFTLGLNEIKQLNPVRYHYKNIGTRTFESEVLATEFSGFLAQDVQRIFPNCVTTDADGYLALNIHDILIASVNAIQELDEKNQSMQTRYDRLQDTVAAQQIQIAQLLEAVQALQKKN